MTTSRKLVIFEGPDGAGKSTAAQLLAGSLKARYVHLSALPQVSVGNLGRIYVEAILPALLGYQDVVLDRCWLSERPYGNAFRRGLDRLGDHQRRMLERLALRCGAVVVKAQPSLEVVLSNYRKRKGLEMLENEEQLTQVYQSYLTEPTVLTCAPYDYTLFNSDSSRLAYLHQVSNLGDRRHPLAIASAGSLAASVALIGESFGPVKSQDALYQWPFASFNQSGCSTWLTQQLDGARIKEDQLLWVNSDQDLLNLPLAGKKLICLGDAAEAALAQHGFKPTAKVPHPAYWKRFHSGEPYPLIDLLAKELLS